MQFHIKKGTTESAIKRGIFFELKYGEAFEDHDSKKNIFSNCINIINNLKSKNIIFTSGTDDYFLHRSPFDVACL